MNKNEPKVIISQNIIPPPEEHEISAAWILAKHFHCSIEFLKPLDGYKRKTPDFVMGALEWELKSPIGNSRRTIKDKLREAKLQSPNIVIDTRRTKLHDIFIEAELRKQFKIKKSIYKLLMMLLLKGKSIIVL
ncbi:MAG: hypothetical protein LBN34_08165 [Clostridiales Family XIII bacterium]|jgi:hypothetical protein|nr:hypothetical protein [Clostridiales Family XIII bacterium]